MPIREDKFVLIYEIPRISTLKEEAFPSYERCDTRWRLTVSRIGNQFKATLGNWKLREMQLLRLDYEMFFLTGSHRTSYMSKKWPEYTDYNMNHDFDTIIRNYAVDDKLSIKIVIDIKYDATLFCKYDFSIPNVMTDVALIVEGCKFHVSKSYLASLSEYFHCLFFKKDYLESGKTEINLPKENADAFQQFLELAYHKSGVTSANVGNLLRLSNYYQTRDLMAKCEDAMLHFPNDKMSRRRKLQLADEYQLERLTNLCVNQMRTVDELRQAAPANVDELRPETTKKLLQRVLDMGPKRTRKRSRNN